jgi:hypothetical protein
MGPKGPSTLHPSDPNFFKTCPSLDDRHPSYRLYSDYRELELKKFYINGTPDVVEKLFRELLHIRENPYYDKIDKFMSQHFPYYFDGMFPRYHLIHLHRFAIYTSHPSFLDNWLDYRIILKWSWPSGPLPEPQ